MPFSPTPQRKHSQSGPISNPFDRLGDEILLHIFLYAKVQGDPVDGSYSWVSNPVPWKLSHICRRWRLFTRQTPRLWETLPVFGFWRHSIALIRSSLKLVDGYPARVQISFGPSNQGDKGVEEEDEGDGESGKCSGTLACQELVTAGTQIRTFVCRWLDLYWVEPILPLLHSPCLQNIETAEVSLNTWDRYAKNQNPLVLSVLFGWTPKLRHLYVTVPSPENGKEYPVHHIWPPSSPNLKTFACTGWSIFRALEAVTLQATSSFEELAVCLNRDNPASKHTTTHTLPPLPALKTIRIIDDRIHVPPADPKIITTLLFHEDERILSHLLIPSLEKFVLWRSAITKIPSGLSLPRLQHLDLRRTDIQTVLLQDILEVSPRIAHLYLKDRADLVSSFLHRINQTKGRFLSDLVLLYIDLRKGPVLSNERVKKVRTLAEYLARRPGFIELHLESSWDDEIISSFEDSEEDEGSYDEEDDDDDEDERPAFRDNAPESEIADRGDRSYQEVVEVLQPLAWLDGHVGYEASKQQLYDLEFALWQRLSCLSADLSPDHFQSQEDPIIMRVKKLEDILIANRCLEGGSIITDQWISAIRHASEDAANVTQRVSRDRQITDPLSDEEEYSEVDGSSDEEGRSWRASWWSPVRGHAIYSYKEQVCRHANPDAQSLVEGQERFEKSFHRSSEY